MTTNLTTRSAQADTITAVPPRTVPQGTQMGWFVRLILLALMACISIPLAQAQGVTYTYTGMPFQSGGSANGDVNPTDYHLTASLTVPTPLPPVLVVLVALSTRRSVHSTASLTYPQRT
jgi:hypothetical protein